MARESTALPRDLREQMVQVFKKYLGRKQGTRVFLFGSRATGRFSERSDYDLGIMFFKHSNKKPGAAKNTGILHPIPLDLMSRIEGDLEELPILQRIELVDFSLVSNEFRSFALNQTILLYESK